MRFRDAFRAGDNRRPPADATNGILYQAQHKGTVPHRQAAKITVNQTQDRSPSGTIRDTVGRFEARLGSKPSRRCHTGDPEQTNDSLEQRIFVSRQMRFLSDEDTG
ncbi:MAG TPA: hypothetical protein VKG25_10615 [Bryobacteraceae bacterium]|nr:hypothetical protein [Bryobacteraceae bacterium]